MARPPLYGTEGDLPDLPYEAADRSAMMTRPCRIVSHTPEPGCGS